VYAGKRFGAKELEEHHVIMKACEDDEMLMREPLPLPERLRKEIHLRRNEKAIP